MQDQKESKEDRKYVCEDCQYFQSGRCSEEDEDGDICQKFRLAKEVLEGR